MPADQTAEREAIGARLRAEREAIPYWSRATLARLLRQAADPREREALPHVQSLADMIKQWENGKHVPDQRYRALYAKVTGKTHDELFDTFPVVSATASAGIVDGGSNPDQWDDDVKRRAALQLLAALGAGATVPPGVLESLLSDIDRVVNPSTDLGEWERVVHDYGHRVYRQPLGTLLSALTADIAAVGGLLKKGRPPREQAGLLRVSAGLSGMLAEVLGNMGDDRATRRTWNTARRAADASGDRTLQVWTRGRAAEYAAWADGSHHVVATMVDETVEIAGGAPSSGLARAYSALAYAAAFQGDSRTALSSLDMVKRAFGNLPSNSSEQNVLKFQESQVAWIEAYVRTTLGDRRAVAAVEDAQALYPPSAPAPITNLHLMRALDLVEGGDPREGLEHAVTSLRDRPRPVLATRQLVGQIHRALPAQARALPAAKELQALASGA